MATSDRRLDVGTTAGPSDRDVLLARLDRVEELLGRVERAQQRVLAMLTSDTRKEQDTLRSPDNRDRFLRLREVTSISGVSRSTIYMRIAQGLFPSPIRLAVRTVAWRNSEIVALNAAQVRGATEAEIRELVGVLEAARNHE